jgi:hypothetical protein
MEVKEVGVTVKVLAPQTADQALGAKTKIPHRAQSTANLGVFLGVTTFCGEPFYHKTPDCEACDNGHVIKETKPQYSYVKPIM